MRKLLIWETNIFSSEPRYTQKVFDEYKIHEYARRIHNVPSTITNIKFKKNFVLLVERKETTLNGNVKYLCLHAVTFYWYITSNYGHQSRRKNLHIHT